MSRPLRSRTSTHGRNMAGARALWRATGMGSEDFGKPIIAIANSYTQFVPGHVHLKDMGDLVAGAIKEAGGHSGALPGGPPEGPRSGHVPTLGGGGRAQRAARRFHRTSVAPASVTIS